MNLIPNLMNAEVVKWKELGYEDVVGVNLTGSAA